jgi:RNA polymerase sigma factor (sigma-70 family)
LSSVITRPPEIAEASAHAADDELVRRVAAGDERAFETIYERYREPLYRYCRSIMRQREDAEEAFQATMLSAYQTLCGDAEREIALKPWLYRIAHNTCISALRKRQRHDAAELTDREAAPGDVGAQTELAEELRQLQRDLAELPDAQRSALVMRELGGLSHVEIGRALGEDTAGVKQLIYSARSTLHDLSAGRDMACESVRRTLSDGDGRALRGRGLRAHLRWCAGCSSWQSELRARPAKLAALAPVLSAAAFHQIFQAITGSAAAAGLGAGVAAAGAGAGAGGGAGAGAAAGGAGAAAGGAGAAAGGAGAAGAAAGGAGAAAAGVGAAGTVGGAAAGGVAAISGGGAALGGAAATAGAGVAAGTAATTGGLAAASGGLVKIALIGSATLIGGGTAVVPAVESAVREAPPPAHVQVVVPPAGGPASTFVQTSPPPAATPPPAASAAPAAIAPAAPVAPTFGTTLVPRDPAATSGAAGTTTPSAGLSTVGATLPPAETGTSSPASGSATPAAGDRSAPGGIVLQPVDDADAGDDAGAGGEEAPQTTAPAGQTAPADPEAEIPPADPVSTPPDEAAGSGDAGAGAPTETMPPPVQSTEDFVQNAIQAAIRRAREAAAQRARQAAGAGGVPANPGTVTTSPLPGVGQLDPLIPVP